MYPQKSMSRHEQIIRKNAAEEGSMWMARIITSDVIASQQEKNSQETLKQTLARVNGEEGSTLIEALMKDYEMDPRVLAKVVINVNTAQLRRGISGLLDFYLNRPSKNQHAVHEGLTRLVPNV